MTPSFILTGKDGTVVGLGVGASFTDVGAAGAAVGTATVVAVGAAGSLVAVAAMVAVAVAAVAAHLTADCWPRTWPLSFVGQLSVIVSPGASVKLCCPAHDERVASGIIRVASSAPVNSSAHERTSGLIEFTMHAPLPFIHLRPRRYGSMHPHGRLLTYARNLRAPHSRCGDGAHTGNSAPYCAGSPPYAARS